MVFKTSIETAAILKMVIKLAEIQLPLIRQLC